MNREQKRLLQRQGQIGADGAPVSRRREQARPLTPPPAKRRTGPREFLHEVNVELRKVAWPTKAETMNYSAVVLLTLVVVGAFIFFLDYVFHNMASYLFK